MESYSFYFVQFDKDPDSDEVVGHIGMKTKPLCPNHSRVAKQGNKQIQLTVDNENGVGNYIKVLNFKIIIF